MITIDQAHKIIAAGEARAQEMGVPVNIAVLDAATHLKGFDRMDGAVLGSIDVAIGKARTAALFQARSDAVWDYCKPGAPAPGLELSNGGLMAFAGGIPLIGGRRHDDRRGRCVRRLRPPGPRYRRSRGRGAHPLISTITHLNSRLERTIS